MAGPAADQDDMAIVGTTCLDRKVAGAKLCGDAAAEGDGTARVGRRDGDGDVVDGGRGGSPGIGGCMVVSPHAPDALLLGLRRDRGIDAGDVRGCVNQPGIVEIADSVLALRDDNQVT